MDFFRDPFSISRNVQRGKSDPAPMLYATELPRFGCWLQRGQTFELIRSSGKRNLKTEALAWIFKQAVTSRGRVTVFGQVYAKKSTNLSDTFCPH